MAYNAPILGVYTLPAPSEYSERLGFRGAVAEMADGSVSYDVVGTTGKTIYTFAWNMLDDTQKATLRSAFAALRINSVSFTPPDGSTATNVTRNGPGDLTFAAINTAEGLRWTSSLELREV